MNMKGKMLAMGMMAMAASLESGYPHSRTQENPKETDEQIKERLKQNQIKYYLSKGLKEYIYPNGSVWALNQKSADKKAKKL